MITHAAAENTIFDMNEKFNISNKDVFLALTKLSFDLSIYDVFGCFDVGGTLVIPKESTARTFGGISFVTTEPERDCN